ncbi:TPA: hypothetical protein ACF2D8_005028 [Serratia marcescens]
MNKSGILVALLLAGLWANVACAGGHAFLYISAHIQNGTCDLSLAGRENVMALFIPSGPDFAAPAGSRRHAVQRSVRLHFGACRGEVVSTGMPLFLLAESVSSDRDVTARSLWGASGGSGLGIELTMKSLDARLGREKRISVSDNTFPVVATGRATRWSLLSDDGRIAPVLIRGELKQYRVHPTVKSGKVRAAIMFSAVYS